MNINRINIDLSKNSVILRNIPRGKYVFVEECGVGHLYHTYNIKDKKKFIKELKTSDVYISDIDVSIYSREGFLNTLDYLYEESIKQTFIITDVNRNNISGPNSVFDIIMN